MICGIIIAKGNSNRFKNKNIHEVNGVPMFWNSVSLLNQCGKINKVYVATDSKLIKDYSISNSTSVIDRGPNISIDEQSWLDVIKYTYNSLPDKYDIIVSILANSINHSLDDIYKGITMLEQNNSLKEIRSFNPSGIENGIIMLKTDILNNKHEISSYIGSITTDGIEIHYKEELENAKN